MKLKQEVGIVIDSNHQNRDMEELEGESIREMLKKRLTQLKQWLKPDPRDSILVTSLKMIYKGVAVLILIAFSPIILIILLFVFFAVF